MSPWHLTLSSTSQTTDSGCCLAVQSCWSTSTNAGSTSSRILPQRTSKFLPLLLAKSPKARTSNLETRSNTMSSSDDDAKKAMSKANQIMQALADADAKFNAQQAQGGGGANAWGWPTQSQNQNQSTSTSLPFGAISPAPAHGQFPSAPGYNEQSQPQTGPPSEFTQLPFAIEYDTQPQLQPNADTNAYANTNTDASGSIPVWKPTLKRSTSERRKQYSNRHSKKRAPPARHSHLKGSTPFTIPPILNKRDEMKGYLAIACVVTPFVVHGMECDGVISILTLCGVMVSGVPDAVRRTGGRRDCCLVYCRLVGSYRAQNSVWLYLIWSA